MNEYYKCLDCGEVTPFNKLPKCKCPNLIIIRERIKGDENRKEDI